MGQLVDPYGAPVSSKQLFAAEQYDQSRPAWPVQLKDIIAAIPAMDWKTVVSHSRKLYSNWGVIKGAIHQKALHSIGRAWSPHFTGTDKDFGKAAQKWLVEEWFPVCDVRGSGHDFKTNLYIDSLEVDRSADFGVILTETPSKYPALQHVPAHRIGQRDSYEKKVTSGKWNGYRIEQGIIANGQNRPVAYRVLGETETDDADIDAQNFIHCYDPEYHDQFRGLPAFSHAINEIRDAMQSQAWEQLSMLMASQQGILEWNETGEADTTDPNVVLGNTATGTPAGLVTELRSNGAGGLIRYFKASTGAKIEQFINQKPGQEWDSFQDRIIRISLLGINWPYSLLWKPDGENGTQQRSAIEMARASILDRQELLEPVALREIRYAVAKAQKLGLLPPSPDWWRWAFTKPPIFSIDPGRDGNHAREQFKLGMLNLRDILGQDGRDYETHQEQRELEIRDVMDRCKRLAEETKIPFDIILQFFQQRSPNPPVQSQQFATHQPGRPPNDPNNPTGA